MPATTTIKAMFLVRKKAGMSDEEFIAGWEKLGAASAAITSKHGALEYSQTLVPESTRQEVSLLTTGGKTDNNPAIMPCTGMTTVTFPTKDALAAFMKDLGNQKEAEEQRKAIMEDLNGEPWLVVGEERVFLKDGNMV